MLDMFDNYKKRVIFDNDQKCGDDGDWRNHKWRWINTYITRIRQ